MATTRSHHATSRHRSRSRHGVGAGGASLLSPKSAERERTLRELLEREVRERELAASGELGTDEEAQYAYDYESGAARDPRLQLSYSSGSVYAPGASRDRDLIRERERELEYARTLERDRLSHSAAVTGRDYPRDLGFGVGAGDGDALYPHGPRHHEAKYAEYDREPRRYGGEREPYPSTYESHRLSRRRSRSPRARIETYAEERAREAEEREHARLHGGAHAHGHRSYSRSPERRSRSRLRYSEEQEREYQRKQAYKRDLTSLGHGLGALSVREREAELARERQLEWEHEQRHHRSRSQGRSHSRPQSSGARPTWKPSHHHGHHSGSTSHLPPYERARLGSPSRTALRSPLIPTPVGGYGPLSASASFATAPYSSTFGKMTGSSSYLNDPLRAGELEVERERERDHERREYDHERREYERRERDIRSREIEDAGRFGESLGHSGADDYDSDEERVYHHPRRHGAHAYHQQHFGTHAEPVASGLGGVGGTRNGHWLDEFYRPVDVRASKGQWLASLQPPSYSLRNNPGAPEARLKLEWIYGYKSFDVRNNLVYNNVGDIVYPVASTVVVYKHAHRIQRHFQAHNDEVRCLAQHPINLNLIATGQTAPVARSGGPAAAGPQGQQGQGPHIAVWDSTDFAKVWVLPLTPADQSIRALAFSGDGKYLASISNDAHHTIKLWAWETRTLLGSARGDSYALFALKWNHKDPSEFVTVGKHHCTTWRFDGAKLTAKKMHIPGGKNVTFYSVAFSEKGYACLGGEDGGIYVFVDGRLVREFKGVHKGKIFCLDWFPGGLISGGGDGLVNILDKKLDVVRSFTFHHRVTSLYCRGNHLLVGTQGSQIFEIVDFMDTQIEGDNRAGSRPGIGNEFQSPDGRIGVDPIVCGHYDGELHGVATTPTGREIVSVGEDNMIAVWDMTTHRMLRKGHLSDEPASAASQAQAVARRKHRHGTPATAATSSHPLHQCARAVAVSPNGKFIVVGLNNGEVGIFTAHDLRRVFTHDLNQYSKRTRQQSTASRHPGDVHPHWVQCIAFSPNGHVCAIGTHGAVVVLLDTRDSFRVKGVLQTHESFLTNLDFSEDGAFLASTDGAYHLRFHQIFEDDLAQSTQVTDQRAIRDVKWSNQSCVLGFAVQGILETGEAEGTLVQCLGVSPSRAFVAAGDDAGQVRLFRFPVLERGHDAHAYHAHASHVVRIKWSQDEKFVVSVGGQDNAICQWSLV